MKDKLMTFFRPGIMLLIVAVAASLVLGIVNLATAGRIEKLAAQKMTEAMQAVLPAASYTDTGYEADGEIEAIYEAAGGGWVVQVTESGSQGLVTLMVGVDKNYLCTGISVIESSETAGLGAIAAQESEKGEAFRVQFIGVSSPVAVTKEGGVIDAISGATITSKAIAKGVTAAIEACVSLSAPAQQPAQQQTPVQQPAQQQQPAAQSASSEPAAQTASSEPASAEPAA